MSVIHERRSLFPKISPPPSLSKRGTNNCEIRFTKPASPSMRRASPSGSIPQTLQISLRSFSASVIDLPELYGVSAKNSYSGHTVALGVFIMLIKNIIYRQEYFRIIQPQSFIIEMVTHPGVT